jgi:hypothetical protein
VKVHQHRVGRLSLRRKDTHRNLPSRARDGSTFHFGDFRHVAAESRHRGNHLSRFFYRRFVELWSAECGDLVEQYFRLRIDWLGILRIQN